MRTSNSLIVVLLWVVTCAAVFTSVNAVATRPVEVYIEDHRLPGLSDDDALLAALQEARRHGENWWWINDSQPVILLDGERTYDLDPHLLQRVEIPVVQQQETGTVHFIHSIPAVTLR